MSLPRHYQDGEPSLQSCDQRQVGPFSMDGLTVGAPENVDAIKNNLCRKLDENCARKLEVYP